jgi:hypothetical protein
MIAGRKKLLYAALLAPLVLLLMLFSVGEYRRRTFDLRWAKVHPQMSKDEVRQLLGEPDNIYSAATNSEPNATITDAIVDWALVNWYFDASYEKWAYGNRRLLSFEPSFPYLALPFDGFMCPEKRDHVVYFTNDGKVLKSKYPYSAFASSR